MADDIKTVAGPPEELNRWDGWSNAMSDLHVAGWTPCRFGVRVNDRAHFVFGIVKGDFGVWSSSIEVCYHPADERGQYCFTRSGVAIMCSLTHVPTGLAIAVLDKRETACEAADVIAALEFPGSEAAPEEWLRTRKRINAILNFNGICESEELHAHLKNRPGNCPVFTRAPAPDHSKAKVS